MYDKRVEGRIKMKVFHIASDLVCPRVYTIETLPNRIVDDRGICVLDNGSQRQLAGVRWEKE